MKKHFVLSFSLVVLLATDALAQFGRPRNEDKAITYEEQYDDPSHEELMKLYLHFQPLVADVGAMNGVLGFGAAAKYWHKDKMDFYGTYRRSYFGRTDFAKYAAQENAEQQLGPFNNYNFFQLGGTYHINDDITDTKTRIVLFKGRYEKNPDDWAAATPEYIDVPCAVRRILGVRLGGDYMTTTTELDQIIEDEGLSLTFDQAAYPGVDTAAFNLSDATIFGNLQYAAIFAGASYSWIKNVGIKPTRGYSKVLIDDLQFTAYADIMFAPFLVLDNVFLVRPDDPGTAINEAELEAVEFGVDEIPLNPLGFRAGFDGAFNRKFSWAYGGEIGYRPGIGGRGFYINARISFPVYGTRMERKVEAFGN